jgi:hypothetical protein
MVRITVPSALPDSSIREINATICVARSPAAIVAAQEAKPDVRTSKASPATSNSSICAQMFPICEIRSSPSVANLSISVAP